MRDLLDRLCTIEARQNELREEHACMIRAIVARAGGVSQAAALLDLDPKTVRARERAVGVIMVIYRGIHTAKAAPDGRLYGETGQGEDSPAQRDADRVWFNGQAPTPARRRLRRGRPGRPRPRGPERPVAGGHRRQGRPATQSAARQRRPGQPLPHPSPDHWHPRPMVRGRIREYIAL